MYIYICIYLCIYIYICNAYIYICIYIILFMTIWGFVNGWLWPKRKSPATRFPGRNSLDFWDVSCAPTKSQRNCDSASRASFTMLIYSDLEKTKRGIARAARVSQHEKRRIFLVIQLFDIENCLSSSMICRMIGNGDVPLLSITRVYWKLAECLESQEILS